MSATARKLPEVNQVPESFDLEQQLKADLEQGFRVVKERQTLLIIDSNPESRGSLEQSLCRSFDVVTAESANDAFAMAESAKLNAVLLDVNMPNIDSFELLNILHNHPALLPVPMFCFGTENSPTVRTRLEHLGASGFLKKPFDFDRIALDVKGLLYSLNRTVKSRDRKQTFIIAFNEREKYRYMHQAISRHADETETLVVLSWLDGKKFISDEEMALINSGKLIYLEMKPSLIVKFPYLQDLSPIFHDLFQFLDGKTKNTILSSMNFETFSMSMMANVP